MRTKVVVAKLRCTPLTKSLQSRHGDIRMLVTMSDKELSRINIIQSVVEKRMRRRDAAHQLALTERQTQRLMNRFRESGAAGLANLRRGRPGNHRLPESLKLSVLSLLHDHYSDFGPTLAAEKIAGEKITVYDYPDGTLAFKYGYRSLNYQVFDKLECIDQGQIVDNKRLGAVLKLAHDKMDELYREGKRDRSKKMPKRRAQARVQEQLRAINHVLANPVPA